MKPSITVYSISVRTLRKLNCFRYFPNIAPESGGQFGELTLERGEKVKISESQFVFDDGDIIFRKDITAVKIVERDTETAKHIVLRTAKAEKIIAVDSVTGRYRDVFEVMRFFMRVAPEGVEAGFA